MHTEIVYRVELVSFTLFILTITINVNIFCFHFMFLLITKTYYVDYMVESWFHFYLLHVGCVTMTLSHLCSYHNLINLDFLCRERSELKWNCWQWIPEYKKCFYADIWCCKRQTHGSNSENYEDDEEFVSKYTSLEICRKI